MSEQDDQLAQARAEWERLQAVADAAWESGQEATTSEEFAAAKAAYDEASGPARAARRAYEDLGGQEG